MSSRARGVEAGAKAPRAAKPPPAKPPRAKSRRAPVPQTHFLNVDLEIRSRSRLDALRAELEPRLTAIYDDRWGGPVHLLVYEAYRSRATPDGLTRELLAALERLSPAGRRLLARTRILLDVGIEAGDEPRSFAVTLEPETVARAAALGARIAMTVYPADRATPREARAAWRARQGGPGSRSSSTSQPARSAAAR